METVWVKIIREKSTGRKDIFRTTKEHYVPEGWEQVDLIETFTIGGPLPYGENNPYIKAKREKEAKENKIFLGFCVALVAAILLFIGAVLVSA